MNVLFTDVAWEEYTSWLKDNRRLMQKINLLIEDIKRTPYDGIGKPEALKHDMSGYWSRRINSEHRLVYKVDDQNIYIVQCRYHY